MNSYRQSAAQRYASDWGCNMPAKGKQSSCSSADAMMFSSHGKTVNFNSRQENFSEECLGDMNEFPLAMAYVPWQSFENLNEPYNALECGTLFKDLYLCFGRGGC